MNRDLKRFIRYSCILFGASSAVAGSRSVPAISKPAGVADIHDAEEALDSPLDPTIRSHVDETKSSTQPPPRLGFAKSKIIAVADRKLKTVEKSPATIKSTQDKLAKQGSRKPIKVAQIMPTPEAAPNEDEPADESTGLKTLQNVADSVTNGVKIEDIIEQNEIYHYSGSDKPDPFVAPIQLVEAPKDAEELVESEEIPIISPLQYFDLKSLVVTGVWETERNKWKAMIETPDRQGIIAKIQDAVGNSGGRITDITRNGVLVREYKLRKDGTQEFSDRMISMAKEADAAPKFEGGKIILVPGAEAPTVQRPEQPVSVLAPENIVPTLAPDSTNLKVSTMVEPSSAAPAPAPITNPVINDEKTVPVPVGGAL